MGLSDSVICGHIVGETGLAAVNLMQGVFELVTFVSLLVSIGVSVLFSTELGAFHLRRAKGYFTLGVIAAVVLGLAMMVGLAWVRVPVLASFGASEAVASAAGHYWLWFLPAAALQPIVVYMGTMCYADGDAKLSLYSYITQIMGNCVLSVPLTMYMGTAGCALGTGLGMFASLIVLMFHFRRPGCVLGISGHFRTLSDLIRIAKTSIGAASKNIGKAILMFVLNAYVIAKFGSESLPILAVAVMTIGICEMFDGVANAVQPLVSVYVGERNTLLTRRVMRAAMKISLLEGCGVAAFLMICPQAMLMLAGVDDAALVAPAATAVRLVAISLVGLAVMLLFNSYYVFIQREALSTVLTLLALCVVPLALCFPFGAIWGINGLWGALALAPFVALGIIAIYILMRYGARRFPLLLDPLRETNIRIFDLVLEPESICETSRTVQAHLEGSGISADRAAKVALLVEEAFMVVRERNPAKQILSEVTVDLNDNALTLVLRDDGMLFDLTDADARISSLRSYLVSNLMLNIASRRNLTTTGFNRNVFKL